MMQRRSGKIVNIASISWAGDPMHTHYAVAKAGVVAFTRSVATQLAPYNINVNAVAPGPTDTGFAGIEQLRASPGFDTPMGLFELATGLWLLFKGLRPSGSDV